MAHPLDDLASRWRANPDAASTIALCDALRVAPEAVLVDEVGQTATTRHGGDAAVLTAAARMYMASQRLGDAQTALVAAGKAAPRDPAVYRWLGEVLLRRGDADRAVKVLERAVQFGGGDPQTRLWIERAKVFKPMQASAGMKAVAAEIARAMPVNAPREPLDSMSDSNTTEVLVVKAPPLGRPDDDDEPLPRLGSRGDSERAERGGEGGRARPPAAALSTGTSVMRAPPPPARTDESVTRHFVRPSPSSPPAPSSPPLSLPGLPSTKLHDPDVDTMTARFDAKAAIASARPPAQDPSARPQPRDPSARPPSREARVNGPTSSSPMPAAPSSPASAPMVAARPPDVKLGGAPVALDPRDVLGALELAGIFEPQTAPAAGAVGWDRAQTKPRARGSIPLVASIVVFTAATLGLIFFVRDRRAKEHARAEALLEQVDRTLHASRGADLAAAEQTLARVFELDSRSPRAALTWLRERALLGLLKGGENLAFEDAIARAREVGVPDRDVAFAHVASFLFQGDTVGAAGLLPTWDGPAAGDAWYQLLAGAALERAGDARAIDRYEQATKIDPELVAAQVARVRATIDERDPVKGGELAKQLEAKLPERAEPEALVALAWGRDPARPTDPPPEVEQAVKRAAELPLSLAVVPPAVTALQAIDKHDLPAAKEEITRGLSLANAPSMAAWLGGIALETGDEALARKAALEAVSFSAVYGPARVLAARVALLGDRLDEALKATEELDPSSPDVAVVRAATAYERLDADALARALDALPPDARKAPVLAALDAAPDALAGRMPDAPDKLIDMADGEAPWSDLVAIDVALDAGDLDTAGTIAAQWKGAEDRPLRALRLARLARYQGKLESADALSLTALNGGTVTPRVLAERVLVLVARGHGADAAPLLARYPLVLGPLGTWLSAYVAASAGKVDEARGRTASIDPPPALAPLPSRAIAAAALGAMKDRKRGVDEVKALVAAGALSPDVAAAAAALGFRKVEHGKKTTWLAP